MSNVPTITFGATGPIAPTEAAILTGVAANINAAFGGGLNPDPTTPQGQLAASETAIIGDKNSDMLYLSNQMDPAYNSGRWQDAIGRIYYLTRNPATPTLVQALCTGLAGTVIPIGSLAKATDGNLYVAINGATIGAGGTVTQTFSCQVTGPIVCPAGSLDTIYQAIPGWDTISNPTDGALGTLVESRIDFEFRRGQSVAANAQGSIGSIVGAVFNVAGVTDVYGYDNASASSVTVQGVTVAAHSIYIAVAGGAQAAIAQAILSKKGPGAGYTGNTTVTAYDSNPLYSAPIPYSVTYQTPTITPVYFSVSIPNAATVPSDGAAQIQAAVVAAFLGEDGGARARVGSTLYALRYASAIAALGSWAQPIAIGIGTAPSPTASTLVLTAAQEPTTAPADITVTLV
ncbi:MAG: baseplate J/gp47 family protein [Caulobacteraceae bacterium]